MLFVRLMSNSKIRSCLLRFIWMTNKDKWLKDLETHQVPWYCLSDLQAWKSPMAKAYNISGVPNCFIIGPDRLIKAKELRGVEIVNKLQELISGKDGIHFYTTGFQEALQQSKKMWKTNFYGLLYFLVCPL